MGWSFTPGRLLCGLYNVVVVVVVVVVGWSEQQSTNQSIELGMPTNVAADMILAGDTFSTFASTCGSRNRDTGF